MYGRQTKTAGTEGQIRADLERHRRDRYRLFLHFPVDVSPRGVDRPVAAAPLISRQERRGATGQRSSGPGGDAILATGIDTGSELIRRFHGPCLFAMEPIFFAFQPYSHPTHSL